ncbi:MAG: DUF6931 family protein [Succinivibrio sp.]
MADKLDWLNEHYVLFSHQKVAEVTEKENYKLPFELKETAKEYPESESFLNYLASNENYKEASKFLSYCIHHRNLAWWAYCVVLSLEDELKKAPPKPRSIADIGKPRELNVPDWAKMQEETPLDPDKAIDEIKKSFSTQKKEADSQLEECLHKAGNNSFEKYLQAKKQVWDIFKAKAGMDPDEFVECIFEKAREALKVKNVDEEKSPIFKASRELKEKVETMRKNTIDTINMAVPMKSEAELKVQKTEAMDAAYSFVIAPDDINAQRCLNVGNTCPDTPEGLLCLICFWSYGNLTPNSKQVVKTPAGLAANGANSLFIMCGLAKGGQRSFAERIKRYFFIGKEIAQGKNSFAQCVQFEDMPHERLGADDAFTGLVEEQQHEDEEILKDEESKEEQNSSFVRFRI